MSTKGIYGNDPLCFAPRPMIDENRPEIVPADPRQRKLAVFLTLGIVVGGVVALWWLHRRLDGIDHLVEENLPAAADKALSLVVKTLMVLGGSLVSMGLYLFWLGTRINRAGQFPPPGMKVIRNTTVRTGPRARLLANLALVSSLLAVLAGTVGMWYVFRLASVLLRAE
ncbi:MAG: hypothetical protein U1E05_24195 [Patescibacteria group bacterium]|nr:hypothetical protein [Patescibacteria group bacterium]